MCAGAPSQSTCWEPAARLLDRLLLRDCWNTICWNTIEHYVLEFSVSGPCPSALVENNRRDLEPRSCTYVSSVHPEAFEPPAPLQDCSATTLHDLVCGREREREREREIMLHVCYKAAFFNNDASMVCKCEQVLLAAIACQCRHNRTEHSSQRHSATQPFRNRRNREVRRVECD